MKSFEAAVIGAGKTGRGFIGRILKESSIRFLIIDKNKELIDRLQNTGKFEVRFFDGLRKPLAVDNFEAEYADSMRLPELLYGTRLIFVSVGGSNIKDVGKLLSTVLEKRIEESDTECSIVLCENANKPAEKLKQALLSDLYGETRAKAEKLLGFSEAAVFCTTIEDKTSNLDIFSENYPKLQCDTKGLKDNLPHIQGLQPIDGFDNFLVRKLYTYNAASALISYVGWYKGYKIYSHAANDEYILQLLGALYNEVGDALCKEYGYDREEQREFADLSLRKFRDSTIADTIARNGREPHRKLAYNERIIGPIKLIERYGGECRALEITAAAALLYDDKSDIDWTNLKISLGPEEILEKISRLEPQSLLTKRILKYYEMLREGEEI